MLISSANRIIGRAARASAAQRRRKREERVQLAASVELSSTSEHHTEQGIQPEPVHPVGPPLCALHRHDVDGLRAIAVFIVVIYHLDNRLMPGGFTGVDIFFVISGFVVAGSLARDSERGGSIGMYVARFWSRRVKRLSPALVTMLAVSALALSLIMDPNDLDKDYFDSALFGLVGNANNHFAFKEVGYFDRAENTGDDGQALGGGGLEGNPYMHLWSLGVEEQFYVLFPLVARLRSPRLQIALALASAAISLGITLSAGDKIAFYILPSRAWQLLAGGLALEADQRGMCSRLSPRSVVALQVLCVLLLVTCAAVSPMAVHVHFPCPWGALPVIFALSFIVAGGHTAGSASGASGASQPPLNRSVAWLAYFGRLSYPIYLWHWPCIVLWRAALGRSALGLGDAASILSITLLLSMSTYHLLEHPVRSWRAKSPWRVFRALLPCAAATAGLLLLLRGPLFGELFLGKDSPFEPLCPAPTFRQEKFLCSGQETDMGGPPTTEAQWRACLTKGRTRATGRAGRTTPRMWLLGDSHAGAIVHELEVVARCGQFDLAFARMFSCMWACTPDVTFDAAHPRGIMHVLADEQLGVQPADIVVVSFFQMKFPDVGQCTSGHWNCDKFDGPGIAAWEAAGLRGNVTPAPRCTDGSSSGCSNGWPLIRSTLPRYVAWLRALAAICARRGATVVVMDDPPNFQLTQIQHCLNLAGEFHALHGRCCTEEAEQRAFRAPFDDAMAQLATETPNLHFELDWPLFCGQRAECGPGDGWCTPLVPNATHNRLALRDTNHYRNHGAQWAAVRLQAALTRMGVYPANQTALDTGH